MQVENSLIAPTITFANIHNNKGNLKNNKKLVVIPIPTDSVRGNLGTITDTDGSLGRIIRGNNFNKPVYTGLLRVPLIKSAFAYLMQNPTNPFTVRDRQEAANRRQQLEAFQDERSISDSDEDNSEPEDSLLNSEEEHLAAELPISGQVVHDLSEDAVERNRNALPFVGSVFLPEGDYAPGSEHFPVNFLDMLHPYVTTLPMFFPKGSKGLHDPGRMLQPTESEFVLHFLRNIRKELLEFPLFTFIATYRLGTNQLISCFHALRGYRTSDNDEVTAEDDNRLRFNRVTGSSDYYHKQYLDLKAKSAVFGHPQIFYTFTNTDRWEVTLACCLSQDGFDIWHFEDELNKLCLLPDRGRISPAFDNEYFAHLPHPGCSTCPYHRDCMRKPVQEVLSDGLRKKLLSRNLYTINRIFDQRARSVVQHVLKSSSNGLRVKAFHEVKEFGDASGWAHVHGVAWRQTDETEAIFSKLHNPEGELTEGDKRKMAALAETIVCVRLSADRIAAKFPDISNERAEAIAELVAVHQIHRCTKKCHREEVVGCWYKFPRLPSGLTLISLPPPSSMDKEVATYLKQQSCEVQSEVRKVLKEVTAEGCHTTMSLLQVLHRALGPVVETEDKQGFLWKGGIFPLIGEEGMHSVNRWRLCLCEPHGGPGPDILNCLGIYYAALSTSYEHELVSQRHVSDAWVADYNPYCLEAMRSNMEVKLIMATPKEVLKYVTKASKTNDNQSIIVDKLKKENKSVSAQKVADRAAKSREVCQSEAFFRIDRNMHLADTNVTTVWLNSDFPDNRGSSYVRVAEGIQLPNRPGEYMVTSRMDNKYSKK